MTTILFYPAAKYSRREEMETLVVPAIERANPNWKCCARWVFGGEEGLTRSAIATLDLDDIKRSSALIVFTHDRGNPQPGGGRFVEMGYAIALKKSVYVIGPHENVFCETPGVRQFNFLSGFINTVVNPNQENWYVAS